MANYLQKYYDILGLPSGASQSAIKKAYFKLAKQYHPDVNPSERAKEKFIEINEAYEILSNPALIKKALYRTYYAKQKKQKTQGTQRQRTSNHAQKARRRASMNKREFIKKTPKEILIRDLKRMLDYFLVMIFFFMLAVSLLTFIWVREEGTSAGFSFFLSGLLFTLIAAAVIFFIPITVIIIHYFRTRSNSDS
ncbi:DnaJ domain-containing protein [Parvicella tangerina]|uniref:Chaperone protein DnaJ n=1 Tax=Parvicella tangerina TaxID=2829795 RepID=A0A916JLN3_9FLAO|nr:DnaJ domain-containing protein [Parvicella tangerina]CAG5080270.1 Chaperone protein DnaJ [Parvicella tangerina]